MVGEKTAEHIKIQLGSAIKDSNTDTMAVRGRDMVTGLPKEIAISSLHINQAISQSVNVLIDGVKNS